jgi:mono/diheme cytochrome c family protein
MRGLVAALLLMAVLIAGCAPRPQPGASDVAPPSAAAKPPAEPGAPAVAGGEALGKTIFTTGIGAAGSHVACDMGSDKFKANPGGCARCHGDDGCGVKTPKGGTPPITYAALCMPQGNEPAMYPSDDALKQAITKGVSESGEPLDAHMPRWQLSDQEFAALVDYLKSLDKTGIAASEPPPGHSHAPTGGAGHAGHKGD